MSKKSMLQHEKLFNDETLSNFDTLQLLTFAISNFASGVIGDTYDLRKVLSLSFIFISISTGMLGLGGYYNVQNPLFFYITFMFIGSAQSMIFPNCIHVMGNWAQKERRGLIVGVWATSSNIGNIIGVQLAAILIKLYNGEWGYLLFIISGLSIIAALLNFLFLIPHPEDVGIIIDEQYNPEDNRNLINAQRFSDEKEQSDRNSYGSNPDESHQHQERLSFWKVWFLPRVFLYAATFFCIKLAVNSMLFWLPLLLKEYKGYSVYQIANVSSVFDVGGIIGSFTMGYLSDKIYSKRSPISFLAILGASCISFQLYFGLKGMSQNYLTILIFGFGFVICGLNNIINASCAVDIGKSQEKSNHKESSSTVTGIIDGSGNLGSALGQFIIGRMVQSGGWQQFMLVVSIDISLTVIPLFKILVEELLEIYRILKSQRMIKYN